MAAMDALTQVALAGTARAAGRSVETGTPVDELLARLPDGAPERRLLLAAGALAIYRQAGRIPRSDVAAPEPAPEERLPACSPGAARLIGELLGGQHAELRPEVDVLPEALERLRRAGQCLPPALLPAALQLGTRGAKLRPALLPVIGERGRWLARHSPWWTWARQAGFDTEDNDIPANAGTVWQEGSPEERLAILRRVRSANPAQAREWLVETWRSEKADFRAKALEALEPGLSLTDEPFLESALDDRSGGVRAAAAQLLAHLPGSALMARMRERAEAMLVYEPPVPAAGLRKLAGALTGQQPVGRLVATPPNDIDRAWQRDGIEAQPPYRVGERAWWLMRVLSHVPPSFWTERFGASPQELIAAAERDEWALPVLEGWARATALHGDARWAAPLWDWWSRYQSDDAYSHYPKVFLEVRFSLARILGHSETERFVLRMAPPSTNSSDKSWAAVLEALEALPTPWSVELGSRYLAAIRDHVSKIAPPLGGVPDPWLRSLESARSGLPPGCFDRALEPWALPEPRPGDWQLGIWHQQVERFTETIRVRRRLMEELPV